MRTEGPCPNLTPTRPPSEKVADRLGSMLYRWLFRPLRTPEPRETGLIWGSGLQVNFAYDALLTKLLRPLAEVCIKEASQTKSSTICRDDDAINVQKLIEAAPAPKEVATIELVVLRKCQKEGSAWLDEGRHTCQRNHSIEPLSRQRGRLLVAQIVDPQKPISHGQIGVKIFYLHCHSRTQNTLRSHWQLLHTASIILSVEIAKGIAMSIPLMVSPTR